MTTTESQIELNKAEERIRKQKAKQLFESGDSYQFAGEMRDVDLAKGNFRFAPRIWLDPMLKKEIRRAIDWNAADKADSLSAMERSERGAQQTKRPTQLFPSSCSPPLEGWQAKPDGVVE